MITIRKAKTRGRANYDWLNSQHTFSFGNYYDPAHMGFGPLRVINEDRVMAGRGFDTHGHRDMEILSYVINGALEHKDNLGNGSLIRPGDLQKMSAGTGVMHSEFNPSKSEEVHFLQIWVQPSKLGVTPEYMQTTFEPDSGWTLVGSADGRDQSIRIHQDVNLFRGILEYGDSLPVHIHDGRKGWIQVVKGEVELGDVVLRQGDGAAIEGPEVSTLETDEDESEVLLFDMTAAEG